MIAEPRAKSPADWVFGQRKTVFEALCHEGIAGGVMDLLRMLEVYARDNMRTMDDVEIADMFWANGRLVVEFKIREG